MVSIICVRVLSACVQTSAQTELEGKAAEYALFDGVKVPSCGHVLLLFYPFGNAKRAIRSCYRLVFLRTFST